jgi:predicted ATPase/DNA-binding XRE family transcriptional regulator
VPTLSAVVPAVPFGSCLRAFRESAGFTQQELATIAGLSVDAVSALERGERKRPHVETVRALASALDLSSADRDRLMSSARSIDQERVAGFAGASLPTPLLPLVGRDTEIGTLDRWLADPGVRLMTLTGPGGAGKTRLALELARRLSARKTTRVAFVPLAAIRNAALVPVAIAEALALPNGTREQLPRHVHTASGGKPSLLVLDNFEHVIGAASIVADLLSEVGSMRVLTTSRAPLRIRGEREYVLAPLALPEAGCGEPAEKLARYPAIRLFIERVQDVQPEFRLTAANAATVTEICRRLDGLPLALELAAPWMKVLPAENLLKRLRDDVLLSTAGPRDLPERQQTINATVAWSYQLLDPDERHVFRRLGALPARFPVGAAAAVLRGAHRSVPRCTETLQALAKLIDRSLVSAAGSALENRPVFQVLETVRAYAALELCASGEREDAMEGLAAYCIREASAALQALTGQSRPEWLTRVREDLDLYRGGLAWLHERGRETDAACIESLLHDMECSAALH